MRARELKYQKIRVYPDFARPRVGLSGVLKPLIFLIIRVLLMFAIVVTPAVLEMNNVIHFPMWASVLIAIGVDIVLQLIFLSQICLTLIRMYQVNMGMHVRKLCNLTPSCSEYAATIIQMYGIYRGFKMCVNRLILCSKEEHDSYRVAEYPYIIVNKKGE